MNNDLTVDIEFINRLSSSIPGFMKKRKDLWNARCPICGDSATRKHLKRFFVYLKEGHYSVKCHNCGYAQPFSQFLEDYYPHEHTKYLLAKLPNKSTLKPNRFTGHLKEALPEKVVCKGLDYSTLKRFDQLKIDHPARKYIDDRKIPYEYVYYAPNFSKFINHLDIEKYKVSYAKAKEPRLIIPFYREDGLSTVFQARAFSKGETLRYITIKEDEGEEKIFGLERVKRDQTIYCSEGPLDSLMIPNCIAMSGISLKLPEWLNDIVYIFDNEPRHNDVIKNMRKKLLFGNRVVIFPNMIKYKDLNDMIVKGGMSSEAVLKVIEDNIYQGPEGLLRLKEWSK